jgi:hypothetical protein
MQGDTGRAGQCARRRHDRSALEQHARHPRRAAAADCLGQRSGTAARADVLARGPVDQRAGDDDGGRGSERRSGAVDQPAYRTVAQTQRGRDLVVALTLQRGAEHDLPLQLR